MGTMHIIVTIGCNNVFGHDPPSALTTVRYPDFLYDSTGASFTLA